MNKLYFSSLAKQFLIFISIIIFMAMGFNAYIQYKNEKNSINQTLHVHGKSLSELLASVSIEPLLIYDDVTLNEYARFTSQQRDIVYAVVMNAERIALTHYLNKGNSYIQNIGGVDSAVDVQPIFIKLKNNPNILFVETPIRHQGEVIAYSWVGLDRRPYHLKMEKTLNQIMLITIIISLFVGGAIYLLFRNKIFEPIDTLIQGTKNIANFEFESPVVIKNKGELSILAEYFDNMRNQLKSIIESRDKVMDELTELNNSLEERVTKRTHELEVLNSKVAYQAMHDPLTGLPNRLLIIEHLQKEISHARRNHEGFSVFMIDLNNFKDVNDTLGHPVGDGLLKEVAQRLKSSLRESDTVGRLGGDEFAVILSSIDKKNSIVMAEKIIEKLVPSISLENHVMKIGASIGIAMYPEHGDDHTALIRKADVAMYEAKSSTQPYCVYRPELDKFTQSRVRLLNDLDEAIENNALEIYYQPKVELLEGRVRSVEALIRWKHSEHGWIPPGEFIPLAENSNLINQLSYWVLNKCFSQWRTWREQGIYLQIALNLSARNLDDPRLIDIVSDLMGKYQLEGNGVKFEITESAVMANIDVAMNMLNDPIMKKIEFSIDDFGTGYSSLSYLKKLPVHEVKIDKAFVSEMHNDEDDKTIVKSVIDLAHNLGYQVIAEGVEYKEVLEILKTMGCDGAQGYYFSRPVSETELLEAINKIEREFVSAT